MLYLVIALVLILCYLGFKRVTRKVLEYEKHIPLALPEECHAILGHAEVMGPCLIEGLRKLCVDNSIDGIYLISMFFMICSYVTLK